MNRDSSEVERSAVNRQARGSSQRPGAIQTAGRRPEMHKMAAAVADDIKRALGRDPRLRKCEKPGLEFLLSMGLLVNDPSARVQVLVESLAFAWTRHA